MDQRDKSHRVGAIESTKASVLTGGAVALLVLLARPTRAGFVTPDFRLIANDGFTFACLFACRGRTLIRTRESQRCRTPWTTSLAQSFRRFFRYYLQIE